MKITLITLVLIITLIVNILNIDYDNFSHLKTNGVYFLNITVCLLIIIKFLLK